MKASLMSPARIAAVALSLSIASANPILARTLKDFFQNSALEDGTNYNPSGTPSDSNDVLITTNSTALTLNGTNLAMGSFNQTNNTAYTVSNDTAGATNSTITLGGGDEVNTVGGDSNDVIYVGGANSSLTFQGPNGGTGSGVLRLTFFPDASGNFNVAQPGATLNISAYLFNGLSVFTKTGAGTLNLSGRMSGNGGGMIINEGTVNFLPGAGVDVAVHFGLSVNNPNTGVGSDVTFNVQTSVGCSGLAGTLASPSTGANTATINLMGATTVLGINRAFSSFNSTYAGVISKDGSVSIIGANFSDVQTFAGNNTYTGTTTIFGGALRVDGVTSGQGNYNVTGGVSSDNGALGGSGTIGLQVNGTITVAGEPQSAFLDPGADSAIGTLHVATSGTGGVIFGDGSVFLVHVGSASSSDLLAIAGGSIDLSSSADTLYLISLAGAFDGSSYTIATFTQNINAGVFDDVIGLPSDYTVVYNATDIMLLPVPEPSVCSISMLGIGLLIGAQRFRREKSQPS